MILSQAQSKITEIMTCVMGLAGYVFLVGNVCLYLLITPSAWAETVEVGIQKMRFLPEDITIHTGDTVRWVNQEKRQYHSIWFESLGEEEGDYFFPDEYVERTFNEAGVFDYRCGPHPKMLGRVTVIASAKSKASADAINGLSDQRTEIDLTKLAPNTNRQKELTYIVKQDCGSCHGMLLKGGLGPSIEPDKLGLFSVADIQAVILHGRPGTPMPPWKGILDENDAQWIAIQLKQGQFLRN